MMALPLFDAGELAGSFNIQRATSQGDFSQDEFDAMRAVAPHLARAAQISSKMESLRRCARHSNEVLDTLSIPLLLLEQNGLVLLANRAAEELIRREPALRLTQKQLTICESGGVVSVQFSGQTSTKVIRRERGRKPLRLTMLPLAPRSTLNASWQRPLCMVVFDDPEKIPVSLGDLLTKLFALTLSEVRICIGIGCEGLSPQECSDLFGVSINTVRTQIRSIYAKIGVKRQAELVRTLTMLNVTRGDAGR